MAHYQMYTTLEAVLAALATGAETGYNAPDTASEYAYLWKQIILASAMVEDYVGRAFVPFYGDLTVHGGMLWDEVTVSAPSGIIELLEVDGDDTDLVSYVGLPIGATPSHFLRNNATGGWSFTDYAGSATLTGWFGYHPDYAHAWRSVETLLAIDDNDASINVTSGAVYQIGDTLRIEDELLIVTNIVSNTLTVERGINGTTAVAHTSKALERYLLPKPLMEVTTEIVTWLYKNRHRVNEVFSVPGGGTVRVGDLSPDILKVLNRYRLECARVQPYG